MKITTEGAALAPLARGPVGFQTLRDEAAEATSPQGVGEPCWFHSAGHGFGSLLGTHPGDDTESDLVDHVSDVVEDGHDFCVNSVGQNVSGWVEQVAERVDDPADTDEPAQSVGAPHELISDLAVVDTLTGGPWGTGSDDDHGPADTTEDESGHTRDGTGLAEVAESDHDEGTGETDSMKPRPRNFSSVMASFPTRKGT